MTYKPGQYETMIKEYHGDVRIIASFDEDKILSIETQEYSQNSDIGHRAIQILSEEIINQQSTDVDTVTGATTSSKNFIQGVNNLIQEAQGKDTNVQINLKDGVYQAKVPSYSWAGMLTVETVLKDNQIKNINIIEEHDSLTGEVAKSAFEKFIPRIIEKQSIGIDALSGATTTSNAIKSAVSQAIEEAGGNINNWTTSEQKSDDKLILKDYDVLVVGLGGSGILSYCSAADEGARVIGIEAAAKLGGNSTMVNGPMVLNSEVMMDQYNNGEPYIDPDEVMDTWLDYLESDEKADIIKKAVYESGTSIDYYINNFDFSFDGLFPSLFKSEWDKIYTFYKEDDDSFNIFGTNKTYQFERAINKAKAMNEKNDYLLETKGIELLFDDDHVIGAKAQSSDGTTYEIYAKSIILATGGFIGNPEMMDKYLDGPSNYIATALSNGSGIEMGQSAGAKTYNIGVPPMVHIKQMPYLIRDDEILSNEERKILYGLALTSLELSITNEGKRWNPLTDISYAPNYKYYVVYTEEQLEEFSQNGIPRTYYEKGDISLIQNLCSNMPIPTPTPDENDRIKVDNFKYIIQMGIKTNNVHAFHSIKEIAEYLGANEDALSETLKNKETIYYLFTVSAYAYGTVGGLDVNSDFNVIKEDGSPVANLFAVGQDSMGVENNEEKIYTPWGGQAQSYTFVSGRNAGQNAAKYAKK
ncbi:FMN-binding protein [Aerococcus loyolae]|uniref:Urocanate reductase n=1 Tax=Aerococcus loyolae TaxID=2976809 RepID=A0ABT4BXB9_9LACT|nr:FMN-binding protein [Aerococcus loyolae]MCY3024909.1 FAD-binding protein [Aerococcus loyolae]MCY3027036.1 FAD-binding protein [Aerococcus loyolae]MCY3028619.1 FAD-binding protein [Aerococcus loyolae]OAM70571.1 hypothetical protein A1D21_02905 [Aerococcus loyolae]